MNKKQPAFFFGKHNFIISIVGLLVIALGFILMSGGGSKDPNIFNPDLYNFQRIRLAPTLVLIGLVLQVVAIFYQNKTKKK